MPAPAMSSRHLYTGHHQGHIQAAPWLRAHRGELLSQDHPQVPVSMPSLFRFDASAVVHTCSSSHRTPAPLTARHQPQRSPRRLLTDAACGGLESPPARRPRRTYLHHWHSTDRAGDLLHRHHSPSGHTWVPETRSCPFARQFAVTCRLLAPPTASRSDSSSPRAADRREQQRQRSAACPTLPTVERPEAVDVSTPIVHDGTQLLKPDTPSDQALRVFGTLRHRRPREQYRVPSVGNCRATCLALPARYCRSRTLPGMIVIVRDLGGFVMDDAGEDVPLIVEVAAGGGPGVHAASSLGSVSQAGVTVSA